MKKSDLNILIVDDEESVRNSVSEALKRAGYSALVASTPDEAMSLSKIKPVNAAIVDCMLPVINGVDLAKDLIGQMPEGASLTLMSGIFRDKAFANESMKKTGAQNFLEKPLDVTKYLKILEEQFAEKIEAPKVALDALLASPFASNRERKKALDHVEEMKGYDLPFVMCILMDADSSGHLNLYSEDDEIFGVSIVKGALCSVDSPGTEEISAKIITELGYAEESEVESFRANNPSEHLVDGLIRESLLSPHVASIVKKEQMKVDLRSMVNGKTLRINFVPDRKAKLTEPFLNLDEITPWLHDLIEATIPVEFLVEFYGKWKDYPILPGPQFSLRDQVEKLPLARNANGFLAEVNVERKTLKQYLDGGQYNKEDLYRVLHFLAVRRIIVFAEQKVAVQSTDYAARIKKLYEMIHDKNPVEIFMYFGASSDVKESEVDRIYKDFAKANHPDKAPKGASEELAEINHKLFSLVSSAHDTLVDPGKRDRYFTLEKQKSAEDQMKAEALYAAGLEDMNRKRYKEALENLEEAYALYQCDTHFIGMLIGQLRGHPEWSPKKVQSHIQQPFETLVARDHRKNPMYLLLKGLYNKGIGNLPESAKAFSQALDVDPNFIDARRELSLLKGKKQKGDITSDLTGLISNFFKKK